MQCIAEMQPEGMPGVTYFHFLVTRRYAVGIHLLHRMMIANFAPLPRRRTMKNRMILAASIALALTTPAFAQDNPQPMPAPSADAPMAPANSQPMNADAQPPMANTKHRTRHHRATGANNSHMAAHMGAHMALTGDEPRIVAYQGSPHFKRYPAVDRGHVPGDPPVIDHSADRAGSPAPTTTTIAVPPPVH